MKTHLIVIASLLLAMATITFAADDPVVGTWKLNLAKSQYGSGVAPRSLTYKYDLNGNELRYVEDRVNADGKTDHLEGAVTLDGKDRPSPADRAQSADTYSESRVDAYTMLLVLKKGGQPVGSWRNVVSKDGKTLTSTRTGKNSKGDPFTNILVFDRQ
jgi:hypothetical protein